MKRCWFGGALLIALLAAGLAVTVFMARFHEPIKKDLEQAAQYALESDWEQALRCADRAEAQWEAHRKFSAAFSDHEPMEEIDQLFAELEIWQNAQDSQHFAATSAQLSRAAQAMADAHALNWWNML